MPIDTTVKLMSALKKTLPLSSGTISDEDRIHVTWNYAGIEVAVAVGLINASGDTLTRSKLTNDILQV